MITDSLASNREAHLRMHLVVGTRHQMISNRWDVPNIMGSIPLLSYCVMVTPGSESGCEQTARVVHQAKSLGRLFETAINIADSRCSRQNGSVALRSIAFCDALEHGLLPL